MNENEKPKTFGELKRYMRDTLEELDRILKRPIHGTTTGGTAKLDDGSEITFGPGRVTIFPTAGPNGRDEPVEYCSPFDDTNDHGEVIVLEDALDVDVVSRVSPAPPDPMVEAIEIELHKESCVLCQRELSICDYCLQPKVCQRVPTNEERYVDRYVVNDAGLVVPGQPARIVKALELCRTCREAHKEDRGLVVRP